MTIRAIARIRDCAPSTVLRQVRRIEARRDDPLLDEALDRAARTLTLDHDYIRNAEEWANMVGQRAEYSIDNEEMVNREARRILRRLCEKDAFLAVATDMDKAIVMRESIPGKLTRTAVVDREIAHAFVLKEWIECAGTGRISRYGITQVGRAALKRLLEEERQSRAEPGGLAEAPSPFRTQHQVFGERRVMSADGNGEETIRYNLAESPLTVLGRKLDRNGVRYLSEELIEAGERLREDFELAQMGPRVAQNWANFLTPQDKGAVPGSRGQGEGPMAARVRLQAALTELGPGLSDIVFRVCCFLEGLETAEKRLGWSARSGKVVLRIALQRLAQHYGLTRPMQVTELAS